MDNPEKFSDTKQVIKFLSESFPACFSLEGEAKPLKIGIFQDLAAALQEEARLSKTLLRSSLRHYTNSWRYLYSVKEGADRIGLDGVSAAKVEKDHAEHAQQQLKESKQKVAERKKQEAAANAEKGDVKKNYKNKPKRDGKTPPNGSNLRGKNVKVHPRPEKLTDSDLVPGTAVTVKVGKAPMPGAIVEIAKDGIQVILDSGMQIKVQESNLRLAPKKR